MLNLCAYILFQMDDQNKQFNKTQDKVRYGHF